MKLITPTKEDRLDHILCIIYDRIKKHSLDKDRKVAVNPEAGDWQLGLSIIFNEVAYMIHEEKFWKDFMIIEEENNNV